ncbi:MAG: hypothetical protein IJB67_01850 [Firmicutes bacterium]|nr:hypothetical protein [Bacillota bacterium]
MQMDTGEICRSYAAAKDKNGQIKVLADLNACSTKEVLNVLTDGGMISGMPPKQQEPIQKAMSDKQAGKPGGKRATPVKWTVDMDKELIKLCEEGMKPQDIAERMGLDVAQVKRRKGRLTAAGYIFPRLKGKCADTSNAKTENYSNGGAEELPPLESDNAASAINPLAMLFDSLPLEVKVLSAAVWFADGQNQCWKMELTREE